MIRSVPSTNHRLKSLVSIIGIALFLHGCSITSLKQRQVELADLEAQQQTIAEQQATLESMKSALETEKTKRTAVEEELDQERKRLLVLLNQTQPSYAGKPNIQARTLPQTDAVVVGALEHIYLSPPDIQLVARIDTGAKTSSLNAVDMTEFERDGKPYVRFHIIDPKSAKKIELTRRVFNHRKIKEHDRDSQSRPVVKMRVVLGNLDQRIELTLTDRSEFKNQILIGRNFLRDYAVVDVSKEFLSKPEIEFE